MHWIKPRTKTLFIVSIIASLTALTASCRLLPTPTPKNDPNATSEAPLKRLDGISLNILTRQGVIGNGVQKRIAEFEQLTGAQIHLETVPYGNLYDALKSDWSNTQAQYDAAVISPLWLIDFINAGVVEDLTERVTADAALEWDDIAPFIRNALAQKDKSIYSIPVDGDFLMAYYRTDLLEKHNLQPPDTWEVFVEIAETFHQQDLNEDGVPDYGACFAKDPGHLGYFMFGGIVSPYLQALGTSQGAFFSPDTMQPLVNNAAFAKGLELYKQANQYAPISDETLQLNESRKLFLNGRCALMIDWGDIPVLASDRNASKVVDKIGATIMPGTRQVLDRKTGQLVSCDKFTCPYAVAGVNHAPYAANLGYTGVVFAHREQPVKNAAYTFLSYLSQPAQANEDVADGVTGFNPYRISQFKDLNPWIKSGMSPDIANNYLGAIGVTLRNQNMVLDLKLPYGKQYQQEILDPVLADYMDDLITKEEAMEKIEAGWETITNQVGRDQQKQSYRSSLGL